MFRINQSINIPIQINVKSILSHLREYCSDFCHSIYESASHFLHRPLPCRKNIESSPPSEKELKFL